MHRRSFASKGTRVKRARRGRKAVREVRSPKGVPQAAVKDISRARLRAREYHPNKPQ